MENVSVIRPIFGDEARKARNLGSLLPVRVVGGADVHHVDIRQDPQRAERKAQEAKTALVAAHPLNNSHETEQAIGALQVSLSANYNGLSGLEELDLTLLKEFYNAPEEVLEAYKAGTAFERANIMLALRGEPVLKPYVTGGPEDPSA